MTSRRAIPRYEQRASRALQFIPGHVGGRVASAQPVGRRDGTVRRGHAVGAAGVPGDGGTGPGVLAGVATAATTTTGTPKATHPLVGTTLAAVTATAGAPTTTTGTARPLAGAVSAVTTTAGTLTLSGVLQWSEYPAGYAWASHPAGITWADLDEPEAP